MIVGNWFAGAWQRTISTAGMLIEDGTPGRVARVSSHWPWPSTRGSITRWSAPELAGNPFAETVAPVLPVVPWPGTAPATTRRPRR